MPQIGEILIRNEHEIPFARQLTQRLCTLASLAIADQARLATAVSQVTQNLFLYSRGVHISFDVVDSGGREWIQVTIEERRPTTGLADPRQGSKLSRDDALNLLDGVRKIVKQFSIESAPGEPIRVIVAKPIPKMGTSLSEETLADWALILKNEPPRDLIEEILQQNRVLGSILDTLQEKDAALERKMEEIEALEQVRDDLVHALVHDLRNPLSSIRSSLSGLLHNGVTNLSQYQLMMVEISYQGAIKLARLVDEILEVYKLEGEKMVMEPASFSFSDLVARIVLLQAPLLEEKKIRVEVRIPPGIPHVDGDVHLVERLIQNLLDNAIKFTPDGGEICISVEPDLAGEPRRRQGDQGQFLKIRVADSGPGIAESIKTTLFEKFTTAAVQERGSGLGLAFCKLVIQAHGGEIWVEDRPGQGAEFVFLLPAAGKEPPHG